ncbi:hypothetical protein B0I37DRAFT_428342 [Chaetomium sp. MPI-CAGE-AT-0009]|nr:hypothetical protein B0I37DRAFT_428342 [Chaetomium sp. MPI-CAGE-AT-0009]
MSSKTSTSALSRARSLRKPSGRSEITAIGGNSQCNDPHHKKCHDQRRHCGEHSPTVGRICSYRPDILTAAREEEPWTRGFTPQPSHPCGFHTPGVHFKPVIHPGAASNQTYYLLRGPHLSPSCFRHQHQPGSGHRARIPACSRQVLRDDPVQHNNPSAGVTDIIIHHELIHHRARPRPSALVKPHPAVARLSNPTLTTNKNSNSNNNHHSSPTTLHLLSSGPETPIFPRPRPLTSAILAPPSPSKLPANVALSAETARLQAELLQLHLLHREAAAARAQWEDSARKALRGRFDAVRAREEEVAGLEGRVVEGRAVGVLREWGFGGCGGMGLEERVVLLDGVVTGLWGVGEPKGRFERVVRGFEGWVEGVERVLEGRRRGTGTWGEGDGGKDDGEGEGEELFIPTPSAAWRAEHAALVRRLDEWRRNLRDMGEAPPPEEGEEPSSLSRILAGCRALVHGMLAELELMEQMEREAVADEMAWVKEMNREGSGGMEEGTPRAGAIWRVL